MERRPGESAVIEIPSLRDGQATPSASCAAEQEAGIERRFAPGRLRVLIVEDEALLGRAASRILARDGHQAVAVGTAEEALLVLSESHTLEPFDVVLSDVGLPGMSGWQLASIMRSTYPSVVVVITSGWASSLPDDAAARLGMDPEDFVSKPYSRDDLRRVLASVASRRDRAAAAG